MLRRVSRQVWEHREAERRFASEREELDFLRREVARLREECSALRRVVAVSVRQP